MTRSSFHLVDAQVEVTTQDGERHTVDICGIPSTWDWDYTSREATELGAVIDYVSNNLDFESFHVVCWSSTKARRDNCGEMYRNKDTGEDTTEEGEEEWTPENAEYCDKGSKHHY